jgi:hypothetical protein
MMHLQNGGLPQVVKHSKKRQAGGVPGGDDLWRWDALIDGGPNGDKTLPLAMLRVLRACGVY